MKKASISLIKIFLLIPVMNEAFSQEKIFSRNKLIPLPFSKGIQKDYRSRVRVGQNSWNLTSYLMHQHTDRQPEGGMNRMSLHCGIDFRVPAGEKVYSIEGGKVKLLACGIPQTKGNIPKHCTVKVISPSGGVWSYSHLDVYSLPQEIRKLAKSSGIIGPNTYIGNVVEWFGKGYKNLLNQLDISDGQVYNHLHLTYRKEAGANPLDLVSYLDIPDTTKPTVRRIFFINSETRDAFPYSGPIGYPEIKGKVDILIEAFDKIDSFKKQNGRIIKSKKPQSFKLGIRAYEVEIRDAKSKKIVFTNLFDFGDNCSKYKWIPYFALSFIYQGKENFPRGDRRKRRNFFIGSKKGRISYWDTTNLPNGDYLVQATVFDSVGNKGKKVRRVRIAN
jgi:hypothetical protein